MTHGKILYDVRRFHLLSSFFIPHNIVSLCLDFIFVHSEEHNSALLFTRVQLYRQHLEFVRFCENHSRDCCYDCLVKLLISSAITSICFSCNDKMCKQETALIIDHASNKRTIQEDVFLLQKPIVCLSDSKYFEIFRILFFV